MTTSHDSLSAEGESPADEEHERSKSAGDSSSRVHSLTDLFDQLDRAAFKRALENRDAAEKAEANASASAGGS